jgi:hypothetical protein
VATQVEVAQRRLVDGVSREEYRATVDVLQRLTSNMEGAGAVSSGLADTSVNASG